MTTLQLAAIPKCAPAECLEAATFAEAVYFAKLELDLIDEGQEASQAYSNLEVSALRRFVANNRASLASMS